MTKKSNLPTLSVEKNTLLNALETTAKFRSGRSTLPVLDCFVLSAAMDGLTISAVDLAGGSAASIAIPKHGIMITFSVLCPGFHRYAIPAASR